MSPTRGSKALDRILEKNGTIAQRLRERFDKSVLWRLRTGRRLPELESAVLIRKLTRGRLPEALWTERG